MRAARDYDAEAARMKMELQALQDELKCPVLIRHAEESVEAYSRIIKNVWEQESLPLSKLRIYEHYLKAYQTWRANFDASGISSGSVPCRTFLRVGI